MLSIFIKLQQSEIYLILTIFSLIAIRYLSKFGIKQKNRTIESSLLILFGIIFCYTLFYIGLLNFLLLSVHDYWTSLFLFNVFLSLIYFNFVTNFIILIYLFFEQTKIRVIYVYFLEFVIIVRIFYIPFLYFIIVVLPYPICILKIFKQILNGRFNIQSNEVQRFLKYHYSIVVASIAAFYGMFVSED